MGAAVALSLPPFESYFFVCRRRRRNRSCVRGDRGKRWWRRRTTTDTDHKFAPLPLLFFHPWTKRGGERRGYFLVFADGDLSSFLSSCSSTTSQRWPLNAIWPSSSSSSAVLVVLVVAKRRFSASNGQERERSPLPLFLSAFTPNRKRTTTTYQNLLHPPPPNPYTSAPTTLTTRNGTVIMGGWKGGGGENGDVEESLESSKDHSFIRRGRRRTGKWSGVLRGGPSRDNFIFIFSSSAIFADENRHYPLRTDWIPTTTKVFSFSMIIPLSKEMNQSDSKSHTWNICRVTLSHGD